MEKENWEKLEKLSIFHQKLFEILVASKTDVINGIIEWAENKKINDEDIKAIGDNWFGHPADGYNRALDELISYLKSILNQLT